MKNNQDNNPWQIGWEAVGAVAGIMSFIGFLVTEWDSLGIWGYLFILLLVVLIGLFLGNRFRSQVDEKMSMAAIIVSVIVIIMAVPFLIIQVFFVSDLTARGYWLLGFGLTAFISLGLIIHYG